MSDDFITREQLDQVLARLGLTFADIRDSDEQSRSEMYSRCVQAQIDCLDVNGKTLSLEEVQILSAFTGRD